MIMTTTSKLLVANRSLMGVRSAPKPFKHVDAGFLPQFGPGAESRPARAAGTVTEPNYGPLFARTALPDQRPAPDDRAAEPHRTAAEVEVQAATGKEPLVDDSPPASKSGKPKPGGTATARVDRFNPFRRLLWPKRGARPVQGELRLAKVQVLRNDLSDADLEIIAARSGQGPGATGQAVRLGSGASGWSVWRRWLGQRRLAG